MGGGGEGINPFACPYPHNVQARPPRDQRLGVGAGGDRGCYCNFENS